MNIIYLVYATLFPATGLSQRVRVFDCLTKLDFITTCYLHVQTVISHLIDQLEQQSIIVFMMVIVSRSFGSIGVS